MSSSSSSSGRRLPTDISSGDISSLGSIGSIASIDFLGQPPDPIQSPDRRSPKKSRRKQARPKAMSKALKECIQLQNSTKLLIPRLPFQRLAREILVKYKANGRFQAQSIEALRESTEMCIVYMLQDAYMLTIHRKRVTLTDSDIRLRNGLVQDLSRFQ